VSGRFIVQPGEAEATPANAFTPERAQAARVYDVWTGGKDHLSADRAAAEQVAARAPWVVAGARANRAFVQRVVRFLATSGIRQYLDVGCGLPSAGAVHEVARQHRPGARVVYVDHDPLVLVHARALLADPSTAVAAGDVRDPHALLADPVVRSHLDLRQPVAVLLTALLHFIDDEDDPRGIVATFRDTLVPGSYLVLSHAADLPDLPGQPARAEDSREAAQVYRELAGPFTLRTRAEVEALFDGWELVEPGLVGAHEWRPRRGRPGPPVPLLAGVGRLPEPDPGTATSVGERDDRR
jgi:SAM-dependent methyltransferase